MPTALDAGWYSPKGFHVRRHRQYVRATGLPPPSTWASAASSSGAMTAVECSRKSGPNSRQVSGGAFVSALLSGKKSSVGLRVTWYPQFAADHTARTTTAPTRIRIAGGAASIAWSARRPDGERGQADAIWGTRVFRGARVFREVARVARERDMKAVSSCYALVGSTTSLKGAPMAGL